MINAPDARKGRNAPPTENAISSLGKILTHRKAACGAKFADFIDLFVTALPIVVDKAEAKVVHAMLVQFIQKYVDPLVSDSSLRYYDNVVGKKLKNLQHVLDVLATVLDDDELATPQTQKDMRAILDERDKVRAQPTAPLS